MEKVTFDNSEFLPLMLESMKKAKKPVVIYAKGNSMRPFIEDGRDKLVFYEADSISKGDVILAEVTPGHFVCHRIEQITHSPNDMIVMRGDGNITGTETFTSSEVRAKLIAIIRKGKRYDLSTSRKWKIYSYLWTRMRFARRWLLAMYKLLWLRQLPERFKRNKK